MQPNTTEHETRGRSRKEETQERRRRRQGGGYVHGKRLGVNDEMLDFNRFKYRWLNDEPGRIFAKTKHDDWDIVTNKGGVVKEDSDDLGDAVSHIVGTHPNGDAKRAYLVRKPKKYYEEDHKAKMAELDEQLSQMRQGLSKDGASQSDYVRESRIS